MKNNFFTQNKKWLFALAIVNIVLSILYFWSLGGARTNIKIIKTGNVFISEIDGYKSAEATFADTTTGSIGLGLFDSSFVEGIPDHQQVDWITITDNRSGAALFKEEFEGDLSKWQPNNGWEIVNGKARSSAVATELISTAQFGSNYSIEVEVSSLRRMFIFLDVNENGDKIIYSAVPWRDQASGFYQIKDGNRVEAMTHIGGPIKEISSIQQIRGLTRIMLVSYPYAMAMLIGIIISAYILGRFTRNIKPTFPKFKLDLWQFAAYLFCMLAAFYFVYVTNTLLGGFPHVPDAILYSQQAEMYAHGDLAAPIPPTLEHFTFSPAQLAVDGKWFTQYPYGHPLALAAGHLFNHVEVIPGIIGGLNLLLLFHILKELRSSKAGFIGVVLMFCSPFVQMNAINFMSHNTAFMYLALFIFGFIKTIRSKSIFWATLSGVGIGLLLNTRPLITIPIVLIWGIAALVFIFRQKQKLNWVKYFLPMAVSAAFMLMTFFLYNYALTGSFTTTPYELGGTTTEYTLGINEVHTVGKGFLDTFTNLSLFTMVVNDWGIFSFGIILAAFATLKLKKWGFLILISAISIPLVHFFFDGSWIMYGPRFWYEMSLFIFILNILAIESLIETATVKSQELFKKVHKNDYPIIKLFLNFSIYSTLIIISFMGLLTWFNKPKLYEDLRWKGIHFLPAYQEDLNNFNFAQNRLILAVNDLKISNSIVFVENTGPNWWTYGVPLFYTSPYLDSDVIYALDQGEEKNAELLKYFPDRQVYIGNYDTGRVELYQK